MPPFVLPPLCVCCPHPFPLWAPQVYFLFAEVMDVTDGFMQWVRCVTLVTTSAPSECYELFKGDSGIWLARDALLIEGVVGRRASSQAPSPEEAPAGVGDDPHQEKPLQPVEGAQGRWASKDPHSPAVSSVSGLSPKGQAQSPVKVASGAQVVQPAASSPRTAKSRRRGRKLGGPGASQIPSKR